MKKIFVLLVCGMFVSPAVLGAGASENTCVGLTRGVSDDWLRARLEHDKNLSETQHMLRQAVQNNGSRAVSLNRDILARHNEDYTVTLQAGNPTNQFQSGRCWIFADLNSIRTTMIGEGKVGADFEFSQTYLHFFNMLEKSAKFLDQATDDALKFSSGTVLRKKLTERQEGFGDGGWHEYFAFLVARYGLVPKGAMRETVSSMNTAALLADLKAYVTTSANEIQLFTRKMRKEGINPQSEEGQKRLEVLKSEKLNGAWDIIATHLGTPPTEFEWRIKSEPVKSAGKTVTQMTVKKFSPGGSFHQNSGLPSFAKDFVQYDPRDYVTVVNDPFRERDEVFEIKDSSIGTARPGEPEYNVRFINMTSDQMQNLVMKSIDGGHPVWFAGDILKDLDPTSGILHPDILKRSSIYGFEGREVTPVLSIRDQIRLQLTAPNHAMSLIGYDRPDPLAPPIKFLDENSWGPRTNPQGQVVAPNGNLHLYREWFDKYVFVVMIHKKFLSDEDQQRWTRPAKSISRDQVFQ